MMSGRSTVPGPSRVGVDRDGGEVGKGGEGVPCDAHGGLGALERGEVHTGERRGHVEQLRLARVGRVCVFRAEEARSSG